MKKLILLLLLCLTSWGAIAIDNTGVNGLDNGGTGNLTYSFTMGTVTDGLLVVTVWRQVTDDISGVTFNGVALTKVGSSLLLSTVIWVQQWYLLNPASGAHNIVISAPTNSFILSAASSYSGVNQSGQPDSSGTNTAAAATSLTTSTTVVVSGSWAVLSAGQNSTGAYSAGTGATLRARCNFDICAHFDSNGSLTPGSQSEQATIALAADMGGILVSYAPTATKTLLTLGVR